MLLKPRPAASPSSVVLGQTVLVHISSSFCLGINTKVRGHSNGQLGSSRAQHPYGPSPERGAERQDQWIRSIGVALVKSLIAGSIDHRQAAEAVSPSIFIFGLAPTVSGTTTALCLSRQWFSLTET